MVNDEMGMRTWVENNLGVTTATLSRAAARRWQRLMMRDDRQFYALALFGFITRRRQEGQTDAFPESEFVEFCAEFVTKLRHVLQGRGATHAVPMFRRVGVRVMHNLVSLHG